VNIVDYVDQADYWSSADELAHGCQVIMILEFLKMHITRAQYILHGRPVTIKDA
jgi:hypothetical protein